ncbi:MAG: AsmA family protein [Arenicellales bacterium]
MFILKPLKYLGIGIAIIAGILVFMSITGTALPLNFLKTTIQDNARNILGRELVIEGKIGLIPGFSPEVFIQGANLANNGGWQKPEFASVDHLSAELHLLPLLDSKIHVGDVILSGVHVDLVKPQQGKANWVFDLPASDNSGTKPESPDGSNKGMRLSAVDSIQLKNIFLSYTDEGRSAHYDVELMNGLIRAPEGESASIDIEGMLNTLPLTLQLTSDPLQELYKQTFPIHLNIKTGIGSADLSADVDVLETEVLLAAKLQGHELNQLNEKLGIQLPSIQSYQVSALISYAENELKVDSLQAIFDDNVINAAINISHRATPMALSGNVDILSLDLDPFLESVDDTEQPAAGNTSDQITPDESTKSDDLSNLVQQLSQYAADLQVNIGQLTAGDIVVSDSRLQLTLADGKLDAPLSVVLNSIPMEGNLSLLAEDTELTVNASLLVENNDIGDLEQWFKLDGIDGSLGKFSLNAETSGHDLQSLLEQLSTGLVIEGADLRYGGSENAEGVPFVLESLSASVAVRSPLKIDIDGALRDEAFNLSIAGGDLRQLVKGKEWPLNVAGSGAGAKLHVEGIVRKPGEQVGSEIELILRGSDLGDLHAWLGVAQDADAEYKITASAKTHSAGWEVSSYEVALGSSNLKGKVTAAEKPDGMLFDTEILSDLINVPELTSFFPQSETAPVDASERSEDQLSESFEVRQLTDSNLGIPILPEGIALPDMDIDISINELRPDGPSFTDIGFHGSIRNGILNSSPFSMRLDQAIFTGDITFDSLSTPPSVTLLVETGEIDIGDLLDQFGVANGIDLSAGLLRLRLDLRGHTLGNILNLSNIAAEFREGEWVLTDPGSGSKLPLELERGTLSIEPNSPISLILEVRINGEPVNVSATMDRIQDRKAGEDVSLEISVKYDDNVLSLKGTSPLPINIQNIILSMNLDGTNTGSLSTVTGVEMPALGPYKLVSRFTMNQQGYYLEKLQAQIGESVLEGTATLKTNLPVPEFEIQLVSERVQLNDFMAPEADTPDQSAAEASAETKSEPVTDSTDTATDDGEDSQGFNAKILAMANGSFNLKAKEVLSGQDWLGEGEINLKLRDSNLVIDPVRVNLPGGRFDASMSIHPTDDLMDVRLNAIVNQFDYGILARRIKPETEMSGVIDLDISLESKVPHLDELLANASGYIDFVLLPEQFEAGVVDLWATGLIMAMLPRIGTNHSLINCMIARFDIKDGLMKEEEFYLDTSKLRATGKGEINFKDQTISYVLTPKAKNFRLFQVQPPLKVEGSIADLQVGLKGGIIGTALQMVATTYTVPIRILTGKDVPEDGSDICIPLAARENKN